MLVKTLVKGNKRSCQERMHSLETKQQMVLKAIILTLSNTLGIQVECDSLVTVTIELGALVYASLVIQPIRNDCSPTAHS